MAIEEFIPNHLIEDILLKIPVESLIRFKCVSKEWYALITSNRFIRSHLKNNPTHSLIIPKSNKDLTIINPKSLSIELIEVKDTETNTILEVPKKHVSFPSTLLSSSYRVTCSCDGILCFNSYDEHIIVLWNPSTIEYKSLPLPNYPEYYVYNKRDVVCGFGYDSSINDYKMIRLSCTGFRRPRPPYPSLAIDVLTLKSNTWRRVYSNLPYVILDYRIKSLKGVLYWIAQDSSERPSSEKCKMHKFDIAEERIVEEQLPLNKEGRYYASYSLEILGDGLSLLSCNVFSNYNCWDMWLMKAGNWTKFMTLPEIFYQRFRYFRLLCLSEDDAVLMHAEGGSNSVVKGVIYDPRLSTCKIFQLLGIQDIDWSQIISYTHSLVSLSN